MGNISDYRGNMIINILYTLTILKEWNQLNQKLKLMIEVYDMLYTLTILNYLR